MTEINYYNKDSESNDFVDICLTLKLVKKK